MDAFLARFLTGAHFILTWKSSGGGWSSRAWPCNPAAFLEAAGFAQTLVANGAEVYHALASFKDATLNQRGVLQAKRTRENVQLMKVLVADADVHRDGDGKDPSKVFTDQAEAIQWMADFTQNSGVPAPNLAVSSGYGIHWYWVLEDALPVQWWQQFANGLVNALQAHGWRGDTAPTVDAARILRPPGTANFKAGMHKPAPVAELPAYAQPDYPNEVLHKALEPYMTARSTGTGTSMATVHTLGPRPGHIPEGDQGAGLNEAAHEGIEHREYFFAHIAEKCLQVKQSLAVGGLNDVRDLWRRFLHLAKFTKDGEEYAHKIGEQDPRYTNEGTEREYHLVGEEITRKSLGAPRCARFDLDRPGVCPNCPFWGKLNSPISLGAKDGDLPPGYKRGDHKGWPQIEFMDAKGNWRRLIKGDLYAPRVGRRQTGGFTLVFCYELGNTIEHVSFSDTDMAGGPALIADLASQGLSPPPETVGKLVGMFMAWITQIREMRHVQPASALYPFGWTHDAQSKLLGVVIAGDHYRTDGTVEKIPGGDTKLIARYTPEGTFENWREAARLFEHGRADLQLIIAQAFASPLFQLISDIHGMSWNFWSVESGIGKTSALKVGQTVWGNVTAISNLNDTPNAVAKLLSEPRILARFWDELRLATLERITQFVDMIYMIPSGREKQRMHSDTSLRDTGEWNCALVFTSNRSHVDHLLTNNEGTDSGVQRLFEVEMAKDYRAFDATVGPKLALLDTNYGWAGRRYAQWLVTNIDLVRRTLARTATRLNVELAFKQEERFLAVAMTTAIAGAFFAREAGVFDFDMPGIWGVLKTALAAMREQRTDRTLVSDKGGYRVEELVSRFMSDEADYRLRTNRLGTQGGKGVTVLGRPRGNEVRYQIAEGEMPDAVLRISRVALNKWLGGKHIPSRKVVDQLEAELAARTGKLTLGGGTEYASSQLWCIDLPMVGTLRNAVSNDNDSIIGESPGAS